jgi:hypothetical protein
MAILQHFDLEEEEAVKRVVVESSAVCFFKALWSCYSGLFFSEDLDQSIHLIFDLQFVTSRRGRGIF